MVERTNLIRLRKAVALIMATITKKELVDRIAAKSGCKRTDVKQVIQTFLDELIDELGNGNRLEFRDFGVFECKERASRVAQNPKTLERVTVPPKRTVKFKAGRLMKERLDVASDAQVHKPQVVVKPGINPNGQMGTGVSTSSGGAQQGQG
ncbi:MAG: integration host factor subunit beta [Phycisphaeraceae bacterium]|nr:integration host factor subunit beta [Phycisphaeraceae bacterium]